MFEDSTTTAGVDLSDRVSQVCVLSVTGDVEEEAKIQTTPLGVRRYFGGRERMRVVVETGTHSRWISRLLLELGHEVLVADARKLTFIYQDTKKTDRGDAHKLAYAGLKSPELLCPVVLRGEAAQEVLSVIKARDALVEVRTRLVNHVRGAVKATGARLRKCATDAFAKLKEELPESRMQALGPVMETIGSLTARIHEFDKTVKKLAQERYPEELEVLTQVPGVGSLTALAFLATLEDPSRFPRGRKLGRFLGMTPRVDQSGMTDKQLPITKAGNGYLRRLLVGSAHYILGPFGPDTDLRRFGLKLAERGGKNAKKRAVVAVARKLAVLLLALWKTRGTYERLRQAESSSAPVVQAAAAA